MRSDANIRRLGKLGRNMLRPYKDVTDKRVEVFDVVLALAYDARWQFAGA